MEQKAAQAVKDNSAVVGLPKATSQTERYINTGLLIGSMGIVCQNAMWSGNPVLVLGCAAITVGFMFPNMLPGIAALFARGK